MMVKNNRYVLAKLLALCPAEPLVAPKIQCLPEERETILPKMMREIYDLAARFPGYQADYRKREEMKYGMLPRDGAPLKEYVRAGLSHAWAIWSRAVENGWTRLQFRDWLALHIDWQTDIPPLWPDQPGWREALELLRLAYGLPGTPPTTLNPSPLAAPKWAFDPRHIRMMSEAR
jgi:hypothetical protein